MPTSSAKTYSVPPISKNALARWKKISNARKPEEVLKWIETNMTGDQLMPIWTNNPHFCVSWYEDGKISDKEVNEVEKVENYLKSVYKLWIKADGKSWGISDITKRIKKILNEKSEKFHLNSWGGEDSNKKKENSTVKNSGRYKMLAADYYNHIKKSAELTNTKYPNSGITPTEFYALAIYTSEEFSAMVGIARGNVRGNYEAAAGDAQDLWFLAYATSAIRKYSKLNVKWAKDLKKLQAPLNPPDSTVDEIYLRRDMDFADNMIDGLFSNTQFTEQINGGEYYKLPENSPAVTYMDKGMMSTSYNLDGAAPYNANSNVTLFIKLNKSKIELGAYQAIPLETISRLPLESEILWAPGTTFRITKIRDNRKKDTFFQKAGGEWDWRNGSRQWSATEKLWIYLDAPVFYDPINQPKFDFPTFNTMQAGKTIALEKMGISKQMFSKLQRVAHDTKSVIMIRKTNEGSVAPLETNTAVGKKLGTKGKSSEAFFTKGNITFFAQLAKRLEPTKWFDEQCTLINILSEKTKTNNEPKYKYIPKLLTIAQLKPLGLNYTIDNNNNGIFIKIDENNSDLTVKRNGEITVKNDNIGGIKKEVTYRLVKTTWDKINSGNLKDKLVYPENKPINNSLTLFKIFIKSSNTKNSGNGVCYPNSEITFDISIIPPNKRKQYKDLGIKYEKSSKLASSTWKGFYENKLWELKNEDNNPKNDNEIDNNAPYWIGNKENLFREVRVLAIYTQGQVDGKSNLQKKYYPVVADYDLFMVAPSLKELSSEGISITIKTSEKQEKPSTIIPNIEQKQLSVLPLLGGGFFKEERFTKELKHTNPYGLLSPFDFYVRKEVNRSLGIKAVQHGVETGNLFYTSDIKDPVITIFPDFSHPFFPPNKPAIDSGLCFFMSLEMMFEMMTINTNFKNSKEVLGLEDVYKETKLNYTYAKSNFTSFYALIFNLNWGSEAYYTSIFNEYKDKNQDEKTAFKSGKEEKLNAILGSNFKLTISVFSLDDFYTMLEQFKRNKEGELKYENLDLPLSLKGLIIYVKSQFITRENIDLKVKGLTFLIAFYKNIKEELTQLNNAESGDGNNILPKYNEIINVYTTAIKILSFMYFKNALILESPSAKENQIYKNALVNLKSEGVTDERLSNYRRKRRDSLKSIREAASN